MKTLLTRSIAISANIIKGGGIVAFPTETVYGLGADIFNEEAIEKIFKAKGRPADNPLIAHIGNLDQIKTITSDITPCASSFIEAFFPAPLTVVLPKADRVPSIATAQLDTIGLRMPKNKLALELLNACDNPLVAPSANLSGKPSPTNWMAVYDDLNGKIEGILQGDISEIGLESTVVDCTGEIPLVLRSGAITLDQLKTINPATQNYQIATDEKPRSPGLKHKHYSPSASVLIVRETKKLDARIKNSAFIGINQPPSEFDLIKICASVDDYAHSFFDFFRQCDRANIDQIFCEAVAEKGIGVALMDRLKRASES